MFFTLFAIKAKIGTQFGWQIRMSEIFRENEQVQTT